MLERSVVGASELAHLGSLLYVICRVEPWLFVHHWLPCCCCLLLVWEKERGRSHIAHLGVVIIDRVSLVAMSLASCEKKVMGKGRVTYLNLDECPLMCHIIFDTCRQNGEHSWAGDMLLPHCCHCWGVQQLSWAVEQWLQEVVVVTQRRWLQWMMVVEKEKGLFVVDASVMFPANASHSLLGAHPLDPLVHIFNPSFGTHVSSQFWYTSFILWHSTH